MGFEWIVPIFEAVLGSVVRSALMLLTGYLIKRHLVSEEIAARFVSDGVEHVLIAAPALLALAWSVWSKVKGRVKLLTALQSQPGTTERQLEAKVENGMGVSLKAGAVLLACVLAGAAALSMPACGPKSYHAAVTADASLSQALFALDDAETAAFKANLITPAKHAAYSATILKLLQAGDDLTLALKAWDPAQPAPANIGKALNEVQQLLSDLKIDSPQADRVIFAVQTVLSVLRGAGVLPAAQGARAVEPNDRIAVRHPLSAQLTVARGVLLVESREVFALLHFDLLAHSSDGRVVRERIPEAAGESIRHAPILLPEVV